MQLQEFLNKLPDTIDHPSHGYAELEIIVDKPSQKGFCYRHKKGSTSYGTYGSSWEEIYKITKKEGLIKVN